MTINYFNWNSDPERRRREPLDLKRRRRGSRGSREKTEHDLVFLSSSQIWVFGSTRNTEPKLKVHKPDVICKNI